MKKDALTAKVSPDERTKMLHFLYVICMIEGADVQLLPASFRAMEVSLGLSPSSLALVALCQGLAQWICTPIWGSLADHGWPRKRLLAAGALSWGVLTLLLSMATTFHTMLFLRALNGVALGCLSPISQSLIVDVVEPHERGRHFGWVQFSANIGSVLCAVTASTVSMRTFSSAYFNPVEGWRVAFAFVAWLSLMLACCVMMFMPEPTVRAPRAGQPSISGEANKLMRYFRIPTFRVIVLQGLFGCIPWSAMSFMIFYFQYLGISDFGASCLFAASMVGAAMGGVLGGAVGDRMAKWDWRHGRPLTAQISVFSGIPLIFLVLSRIPKQPEYFASYFVSMVTFGVMSSWCATGVNRPILAQIVDERDRASVFAWLITIDGSFAALFGAPMVGILAERMFGYHPSSDLISHMPVEQRHANADALAHALMACCIVPWMVCLACFSLLHITYKQDVAEIQQRSEDCVASPEIDARVTTALAH